MLDALNLIAGSVYILVIVLIFLSLQRRNKFWIYFISIEYFYLLGLGVYPVALALNLAEEPRFMGSYVMSVLTPLHVLAYAGGALLGFYFAPRHLSLRVASIAIRLNINPIKAFAVIFVIFAIFAILYVIGVGPEQALVGATYSRGGNFEYFDSGTEYAFLKRPMMIGLLGAAYAYFFICILRRSNLYLLASIVIGVVIYSFTVSRYALFQSVILPFAIYGIYLIGTRGVGKLYSVFLAFVGCFFLAFTLLYGKTFLYQMANYIYFGKSIYIDIESRVPVLDSFSHLYYSIDAGVKYFALHGLTIFRDVALSPLGVVPSSIFDSLGLNSLSYQFVPPEDSFSCVNTSIVAGAYGECFVPPYFTGASAYFLPILGGLIFGFFRFSIYAIISRGWKILEERKASDHIPTLVVICLLCDQVMLFIPATISMSVFILLISIMLILIRAITYRR